MASTTKALAILLLAVLLCNAMLPVAKAHSMLPIECLVRCGLKLIKCTVGCLEHVSCLLGCRKSETKCVSHCFKKGDVPRGVTRGGGNEDLTGQLEAAGSEMETVKAAAMISSSSAGENRIKGSLQFLQDFTGERIQIKGRIEGLSPGLHGLHIQFASSCSSMNGPHFNPEIEEHGSLISNQNHRAWCLGNIIADPNGIAHAVIAIEEKDMPLTGLHSILGAAVIVHADAMIGCGIIELN